MWTNFMKMCLVSVIIFTMQREVPTWQALRQPLPISLIPMRENWISWRKRMWILPVQMSETVWLQWSASSIRIPDLKDRPRPSLTIRMRQRQSARWQMMNWSVILIEIWKHWKALSAVQKRRPRSVRQRKRQRLICWRSRNFPLIPMESWQTVNPGMLPNVKFLS